jgi:RNA polymerase sigma factor (sigma-70 family)
MVKDAERREELARSVIGLMKTIARKRSNQFHHRDECESAAWLGVAEAMNRYDPRSRMTFTAFARRCAEREITDMIRRSLSKKRSAPMESDWVAAHYGIVAAPASTPTPDVIAEWGEEAGKDVLPARLDRAVASLPSEDRMVVRMAYGLGCHAATHTEIGKVIGMECQWVKAIEKRAIRRLRIAMSA